MRTPMRLIDRRWGVLATALLLLLLVLAAGPSLPSPVEGPPTVLCDECHDEFVPFQYTIDAPTEVPAGEPFDLSVTVFNEEMHAVYYPSVMLAVSDPEGLVVETGEPAVQSIQEQGSVGFRQTAAYAIPIGPGAQAATFALDGSGGFLDDLDLSVEGPDGGTWSSTSSGVDESISLDAGDLQEGGHGDYVATVSHPRGVRPASFTLDVEVEYGSGSMVLYGPDDLQQDDSHTFVFTLRGAVEGPNGVTVTVSGACVHGHSGGDYDEEDYTLEETVPIEVGDEFSYGVRGDDDEDSGASGLLAAGRALGIVSAALLVVSILTSGNLRWLPRRGRVHCLSSYALGGTFLLHWALLWVGPYGGTAGGIFTGSLLLVSVAVLLVTGARPGVLDGKVMGLTSRRLHRLMTYAMVLVLVVHVLINGSSLAFVREWLIG
jgi:hypothetical protein